MIILVTPEPGQGECNVPMWHQYIQFSRLIRAGGVNGIVRRKHGKYHLGSGVGSLLKMVSSLWNTSIWKSQVLNAKHFNETVWMREPKSQ